MKVFTLILFVASIYLSDQKFIYLDPNKLEDIQPHNTANVNRFIVNIIEYSFVNETRTTSKFRCLGSLISEEFVLTTARCVTTLNNFHIGIQFETTRDDTNDVGYSITFDQTTVWVHDKYNVKDNETYNIALIKFDSKSISTSPPLFPIFMPRNIGSIPKVADFCSIIGRNVQLSSPPQDKVFVIGPNSCYGKSGMQAYCTMIDDLKEDACKVLEGAPLICKNNEIAGIVLGGPEMCIKSGSRYQLRYHTIGDFTDFIKYYSEGPATTTAKTPNSATLYKFSLSTLLVFLVHFMIKS